MAFLADQLGAHQGLPEKLTLARVARLEAGGLPTAVPVRGRAPLVRITEKGAREARAP